MKALYYYVLMQLSVFQQWEYRQFSLPKVGLVYLKHRTSLQLKYSAVFICSDFLLRPVS